MAAENLCFRRPSFATLRKGVHMKELEEWINKEEKKLATAVRECKNSERTEAKIRKKLLGDSGATGAPRLIAENKNGRFSYYLVKPGEERIYLKKQDFYPLIRCLAQKEYNEKMFRIITQKQLSLKRIKKYSSDTDIQDVYDQMSPARKELVTPALLSDEEYAEQWQDRDYMKSDYPLPENYEEILSKKGETVRSKSEKILADMFYDNDIPYRYESECVLSNGKRVFPDFTLLNKRTRQEFIWEHFGMMDNPEYVQHNLIKMREYENSGFLLGLNLLFSYETASMSLSTNLIQEYIDHYLK